MARQELVGYYGKFTKATIGEEITTGDLTSGSFYIVKTLAETTGLPTGTEVGKGFYSDGETLAVGDVVIPLTFSDMCDMQSWGLDFSKSEIDVTTLCDDQNKYLSGRTDVTGSSEGIYTIGKTDIDGGFMNQFIDIVRQDGIGGTVTVDSIDDSPIVAILYKQKKQTVGETEQFYIAPVSITSFSDSVNGSDSQSFSSSFRIAPNDDIDFQLVSVTR